MRFGVIAIIALAAACVLAVFSARAVPSVLAQSAPGSVGTITVTRGDGTLTASWDAVSGATKYHITYSTDNRASWHAPVDGHRNWLSNSITFDADNSKTYIIGVRAGNAYGWSGWNNSAPSGPHTPELAPTPTSTPTPTPTSTPEPTSTPTPTPEPTPTSTPTPKPTSTPTPTPTPTPKPKPAPTHTPTPTPELPPATVGAITVTRADGTITASWNAVSGATKYHITYSADNRASWHAPVNGHRNWLSNSLTFDADNAKTYIIGARAGNSAGWSGWTNSAPSAPHTPEPTPTPTPIPVTVTVTDITATTATITIGNYSGEWHYRAERQSADGAGGASAASAAVGASSNIGQAGGLGCTGPVNDSETAISGNDPNSTLNPNSRYIINAYQGENCDGAAMASGSFQTLSSAIAAPSPATVYRGLDFLDVEWTAVSGATGYDIMYNDDYTGPWETAVTGVTTTNYKIPGTLNNKPYIVAVRAVKGQDKSTWTNSPINYPAVDPLPAGSVTVTRADGQISVSWTQCDVTDANCSGHTPITQYLIRLSDNGGTSWTTAKTLTAYTSQSVQVITSTTENGTADIVNAKSYIVSVGIKNRVGTKWASVSVGPWAPKPGDRDSGKEFDTNTVQYGIWSDGTTMYVQWYSWSLFSGGIWAYNLSTGSRDTSKEFNLHSDNDGAEGLWSDGTTAWVSDWQDNKLYAYNLSTKSHDGSKDISLHADNGDGPAIWSDGTTMWVSDITDYKLYAYKMSDKSRDASKDFNSLSAAGNTNPRGLWSDGVTMWVSDYTDSKVYAYKMSDKSRDSSKDYELHSDNDTPVGMWSDGTTMYVADYTDGKLYAYYAFPRLTASDFSLTGATLNNSWTHGSWYYKADTGTDTACRGPVSAKSKALTGLSRDTTYEYTAYSKSGCASGYEMADVTFTTATYGDRDSSKDKDISAFLASGEAPADICSDGTTMYATWFIWSLQYGNIRAFDLTTGSRDTSKEFNLRDFNRKIMPFSLWCDASTVYVGDREGDKIYAYNPSTGARDTSKEFNLHSDNSDAWGMWSDGTTLWVSDETDDKLYAYNLSDGTRDASKDYNTLSAAGNNNAEGIWSDGATLWTSDYNDGKLYAYKVSDKSRDTSKDYELHTDNASPTGIWSDGTTMYAMDLTDKKIYAYYAFPRPQKPAAPASVTVTRGVNFLDVSWSAAAGATGYDIRYSSDGKRTWSSAATGATGSSHRITGISINKSYMVAVRASNGAGSSGWTNSAVNWKPVAPWRAESIAVTRTNGALNISWTQCDAALESCNGGLPITGYLTNISSDNGANYTRAKTLTSYTSGAAVSITSTVENGAADIVNSQSYIVSVGIQNGVGVTWANATVGPYSP